MADLSYEAVRPGLFCKSDQGRRLEISRTMGTDFASSWRAMQSIHITTGCCCFHHNGRAHYPFIHTVSYLFVTSVFDDTGRQPPIPCYLSINGSALRTGLARLKHLGSGVKDNELIYRMLAISKTLVKEREKDWPRTSSQGKAR